MWRALTHWKRPWCWERLREPVPPVSLEQSAWLSTLNSPQWRLKVGSFSSTGVNFRWGSWQIPCCSSVSGKCSLQVPICSWHRYHVDVVEKILERWKRDVLKCAMLGLSAANWHLQWSLAFHLYKDRILYCCSCWFSTPPERSSGWRAEMKPPVLWEKLAEQVFR